MSRRKDILDAVLTRVAGFSKFIPQTVNQDTTADGAVLPLDLSVTGVGAGETDFSYSSGTFAEVGSWQIDVSGYNPVSGAFPVRLRFSVVGSNSTVRWRLQAVDKNGAVVTSSGYSAEQTSTGTFNDTLTIPWPSTGVHLRLSLEAKTSGGTEFVRVNYDVSFVDCTPAVGVSGWAVARQTGRVLVDADDCKSYPAAFVWGSSEVKSQRTVGGGKGRKTVEMDIGVRFYTKGANAFLDLEMLAAALEAVLESTPRDLGLAYVFALNVSDVSVGVTSEELSEPYGIGDLVLSVQYTQDYGVP